MDYGEDEDDDVFEEQVPNEKAQKFTSTRNDVLGVFEEQVPNEEQRCQ
jgi:hypothetical protein